MKIFTFNPTLRNYASTDTDSKSIKVIDIEINKCKHKHTQVKFDYIKGV